MSSTRPKAPPCPMLVAVVCLAILALLALLVAAGVTRSVDVAIIDVVRSDALLGPLAFLEPLTTAGSTEWITGAAVLVLIVELVARRAWLGIGAAGTIGLASLLNTGMKDVVQRVRPDLLPPLAIEPGYSFPSGHSTLSMVAYGIIGLLILHSGIPRWSKAPATAALSVLIFLVGLSRIYLGVHFPSDVLGGWLAGAAVVLVFETVVRSRLSPEISREASTAPGG